MTKTKPIKFKGILKQPIKIEILRPEGWPTRNITLEEKQRCEESADLLVQQKYLNECRLKLLHLFDYYDINDQTDFESLALNLAIDFVDGFRLIEVPLKLAHGDYGAVIPQQSSTVGAPKKWTNERLLELYDDVQKIKEQEKISSDREALKRLRTKYHSKWGSSKSSAGPVEWLETLEARLHDAKIIAKKRVKIKELSNNLIKRLEKFKD
jgi:hypothetical protein